MRERLIDSFILKMVPHFNNEQLVVLRCALQEVLSSVEIIDSNKNECVATDSVDAFISAKRVEGCSEKTLKYYRNTIECMIAELGKTPEQVTTTELRDYLTAYQKRRQSSRVTIDNIRRILSSFYSWLEDPIVKRGYA